MPTLPLEILYEVFDEEEGPRILKKGSLLCKALRRHVQRLLFKDYRMDRGVDRDYEIKPIFSSPHLLQYTRVVRLESAHWTHSIGAWQYHNVDAAVKVLRRLVMDQIIEFDLGGLAFEEAQRNPEVPGHQEFINLIINLCGAPNLRTLDLSYQDCRLLALCGSAVKKLNILNERWTSHQATPSTRAEPMMLTTLSVSNGLISGHQGTSSLDFILDPDSMITINCLGVFSTAVRRNSADTICKVLERSQESLTELNLSLKYTNDLEAFGLGHLKALKFLNIHAPFPYDDEPDILPWLYGELCNALESPLPLEELFIHLEVEDFEIPVLDTSLWAQFASLLANREALPCLLLFMLEIKGRAGERSKVLSEVFTAFEGLGNLKPEFFPRVDGKGVPTLRIYWEIVT
ncbi:hypothetical protein BKA70DRAFT_453998 [Coprinopsis sp. MPI-PUGE-AT-0042]|nr:hypothetical protein BKA70DRAFT_453998 [Coprinopsis sp. MPI-PUGE-AT-0042]